MKINNPFRKNKFATVRSGLTLDEAYIDPPNGAENLQGSPSNRDKSNPDIFSALRVVSATMARLPLRLYERNGDELPSANPVSRIIAKPGGGMTRQLMWQKVVREMYRHGRSLAIITRTETGEPVSMTPVILDKWTVDVDVDENTGAAEFKYSMDGTPHASADILDFVWDYDERLQPISPVRQAGRVINLRHQGEEKMHDYFKIVASIFIKSQSGKNQDDKSIRDQVEDFARLLRKKSPVLALPSIFDLVDTKATTSEQLQLAQLLEIVSSEGAKMMGVSPSVLGDLKNGSYRTVEAALLAMARLTIAPLGNVVEQQVELKLLEPGQTARFDDSELLRGSPTQEGQLNALLVTSGQITPNEARRRQNIPPSDDPAADKLRIGDPGGMNAAPPQDPPVEEPDDDTRS